MGWYFVSTDRTAESMTETQREMVEKNLGLVGAQIKRLLGRVPHMGMSEYWDELFQEGCLGLIQAVKTYDPSSEMTLATYAMPRIHYASWRALHRYRETIRLPERHGRAGFERTDEADTLRAWSYTPEKMDAFPSKVGPPSAWEGREPVDEGGPPTVGDTLRQKLEAAVDAVVARLSASTRSRRDRGTLARVLADQRLLVPEAEFRSSLRQIARETGSSYGRVAACETLLVSQVRRLLSADIEFELLCEAAMNRSEGMAAVIDDALRATLCRSVTSRILGAFANLARADRAEVVLTVLEKAGVDVASLLRVYVEDMADADRVQLAARLSRDDAELWGRACPPAGADAATPPDESSLKVFATSGR